MPLAVADYEDFLKRLAVALECGPSLPEIATAVGDLRGKAERFDVLLAAINKAMENAR